MAHDDRLHRVRSAALKAKLRKVLEGDPFPSADALPLEWMRDSTWKVVQALSRATTLPLDGGVEPVLACAGLIERDDEPAVWGYLAVFAAQGGALVDAEDQPLHVWPVRADTRTDRVRLDLSTVDALHAETEVLWLRERVMSVADEDGTRFLSVMERVFRQRGAHVETILETVGADAAAYADKDRRENRRRAAEVEASYESGFVDGPHPKDFVCGSLYRGARLTVRYSWRDGVGYRP